MRNWDYRYCWLRDSGLTLHAFMAGGYSEEAGAYRDWLARTIAGDPAKLQIMYGIGGERRNALRFDLEPERVTLELTGTGPQADTLAPLNLTADLQPGALPPYARLLLDVLSRNTTLSIRADEAEQSWRVVTPVVDACSKDLVPLHEYPAGSGGPRVDQA